MADEPLGEPIVIRFDGLDADREEIELVSLSKSLAGLSRIITASSHFALTHEVSLRRDRQSVRVVARVPRDGCYVIDAFVHYAHNHPMFKDYFIATASALTGSIITFSVNHAIGRDKKIEMEFLSKALESSIRELGTRDQPTIDRLLTTVEHMADALRPAVKQAVDPIGASARTLTVGLASVGSAVTVDEADKAAIMSPAGLTVDDERTYTVLISELDMNTGSCHVAIEADETRRFPARITDPTCSLPNNPYVLAMAAKVLFPVRAKATYRDGEIERLFISNWEGRSRGDANFGLDGDG